MIEIGDLIRIKDNLYNELNRLGKIKGNATVFINKWIGKTVKVVYVYHDAPLICDDIIIMDGCNNWMVKINNYIEFPIESCEIVKRKFKNKNDNYAVDCNCDMLIPD